MCVLFTFQTVAFAEGWTMQGLWFRLNLNNFTSVHFNISRPFVIMFVPFLIIRHTHTKKKKSAGCAHLPTSCDTSNYTDIPWAISWKCFTYDCMLFFWNASEMELLPCACEWQGGCLAWHRQGRGKSGENKVRGLLVQLGLVLISSDSTLRPGRMLR